MVAEPHESPLTDDVRRAGRPPGGRLRRFAPLLLLAALIGAAYALGVTDWFTVERLRTHSQALEAFTDRHPWLSLLAYVAAYVFVVTFSIPGALLMTLTGGLLFGTVLGAAAAVTGCTGGATVLFLVARTAIGDSLRRRAGPVLSLIINGFEREAASYLLTLRLIPGVPLFAVNVAAGMVHMRLATYVAVSVVGMIPSSLIYASIGHTLREVFQRGETPDLDLVFTPQVFAPLLGLAALSCLPLVYKVVRSRRAGPR